MPPQAGYILDQRCGRRHSPKKTPGFSPIRRVPHDRVFQMLQVDPDLVGPTGVKYHPKQREVLELTDYFVLGDSFTQSPAARRHSGPHRHIPAQGYLNHALLLLRVAIDQRRILFLHFPAPELSCQPLVDLFTFGHNQQAGGRFVKPVHDSWSFSSSLAKLSKVIKESVRQGSPTDARTRVYYDTSRLVDHNEPLILIDDVERNRFREKLGRLRRGRIDFDLLTRTN